MKKLMINAVLLALLLCTAPSISRAAPPALPENELRLLQQQQQQIELQLEERRRIQEEELQKRSIKPPEGADIPLLPQGESADTTACMEIKQIKVQHVTLFSDKTIDEIKSPYENRCLTINDINNLLKDLTNAYIEAGYITSRAFVSPDMQGNKNDGVLEIFVLEGKIGQIILNNNDHWSMGQKFTAFPGLEGKPLNLRDIEQGLDQLNRLPSNNAVMEIEPGETPGSSNIQVNTQSSKTWRLSGGFDNLGQRSTGHYQYTTSIEKDNFIGVGDQFAAYWTSDARFLDDATRNDHMPVGHNRSFSGYFSMPAGYWTISANFSLSHYDTPLITELYDFTSSGDTEVCQAGLSRVIHRDAESKTSLGTNLTKRSISNYIEGARLDVSSYNLTSLTISGMHSRRIWDGSLVFGLDYVQGLDAFGASADKPGEDMPKGEFKKGTLSINWYKPIPIGEHYFSWRSNLYGQYTDDTLYGSERVQIGGYYTVRGFSDDSIIGDSGGYIRNELAWSIAKYLPQDILKNEILYDLELFGAYDYGFIKKDNSNPYEKGEVHGMAFGVRSLGDFSAEAALGKALKAPAFMDERDYEVYARIRYTF